MSERCLTGAVANFTEYTNELQVSVANIYVLAMTAIASPEFVAFVVDFHDSQTTQIHRTA